MYCVGDYVVKSNDGVCRIDDILHVDMPNVDKDRLYYLMIPQDNKRTKLYVPVDGKSSKIRNIISESQAWEIIEKIPKIEAAQIRDEKQREQEYKKAIHSCQPELLVALMKGIYQRKQKRSAQGKKSIAVDEHYFKLAENSLYSELAFVMGKTREEMQQFISEKVKDKVNTAS